VNRIDFHNRGLLALLPIKTGEEALFIPSYQHITHELCTERSSLTNLVSNMDLFTGNRAVFATFILIEKRNPKSVYKAFVESLPTNYSNFPLFFSEEDQEWFGNS